MRDFSDEELVNLYVETQNSSYYSLIYERYFDKVRQKCLRFTKDETQAEDLTQDIFLRLIYRLNSYKQQSRFSTWLYSITRNYCTDHIRVRRVSREVAVTESSETVEQDTSDANQLVENELIELNEWQIKQAMTRLPPEEQWLLQMKYLDGFSIKEIAAIFCIKQSAVKMRLKRSRDKLRQFYETEHVNESLPYEIMYN